MPPCFPARTACSGCPCRGTGFRYLTVTKEGWATVFLTDVTAGRGFRVTLDKATRLRGTVGGEGVGRVSLLLKKNKFTRNEDSLDHERNDLALRVSTDEHGAYDFPVEPGRWRWEASSADGRFARGETNVEPGKTVDLGVSLQRGADVTFELVDCESGQPVPGIEVYIAEQRADRVIRTARGSNRVSDAGGRMHWENLPPGELEFVSMRMRHSQPASGQAQHPYARWWRADEPVDWRRVDYAKARPTGSTGAQWLYVDVQPGMPMVRVLMERGVKISGRVERAADGKGVAGANVQAIAQHSGELQNFSAQTDQDGNFLAYIPAGNGDTYHLCAYTLPGRDTRPGGQRGERAVRFQGRGRARFSSGDGKRRLVHRADRRGGRPTRAGVQGFGDGRR